MYTHTHTPGKGGDGKPPDVEFQFYCTLEELYSGVASPVEPPACCRPRGPPFIDDLALQAPPKSSPWSGRFDQGKRTKRCL